MTFSRNSTVASEVPGNFIHESTLILLKSETVNKRPDTSLNIYAGLKFEIEIRDTDAET